MLTRIRNANKALHEHATMPSSRMKVEIARLLKEEGYIRDYHVEKGESFDTLVVDLKFGRNRERVISGLKRVSKPGRRGYAPNSPLPPRPGGLGGAGPAPDCRACWAAWESRSCPRRPVSSPAARRRSAASAARSCASSGDRMSRIGKRPIEVPSGVTVQIEPGRVAVTGPLGSLQQDVPQRMQVVQEDGNVVVTRPTERGEDRALHGLTRTLIANMVEGVTKGFEKKLEIQGVGYRAALKGTDLELQVGYSHPVTVKPRTGISFEVPVPTQVIVKGTDKQQVGQRS